MPKLANFISYIMPRSALTRANRSLPTQTGSRQSKTPHGAYPLCKSCTARGVILKVAASTLVHGLSHLMITYRGGMRHDQDPSRWDNEKDGSNTVR